jgi:hypothetical protein
MPSKIRGMMVVAAHKLAGRGSDYRLSEFGIDSEYEFRVPGAYAGGPDFWYRYLAEKFRAPALNFVPLAILPFTAVFARRLIMAVGIRPREAA